MYKIERNGNAVFTDAPYYVGRVACENWLDSIEETYAGEKAYLSAETEGRIWMTVSGGSYKMSKDLAKRGVSQQLRSIQLKPMMNLPQMKSHFNLILTTWVRHKICL